MIKKILEVSSTIKNDRTIESVAIKAGEEMGEVMSEVSKLTRHTTYKTQHDSLKMEIADAIITLVDLGYVHYGDNFQKILEEAIEKKIIKWEEKYNKSKIVNNNLD